MTTNGTARWGQRALPFQHNGFGQDDEWVAANFTNANEILSVGYPQWVDAQMGEGLTNGLYKFTATCFCLLIVREGQPLLYKLHSICLILRNSIMVKCKKMNRLVIVTVCSFSQLIAAVVVIAARNRRRSSFKRDLFYGAKIFSCLLLTQ